VQGGFEGGDDVDYRAIQEHWGWIVAPLRMRGVQDYVIPIESTAQAAGGFNLQRFGTRSAIQLLGDEMIWVPKLTGSLVCDPAEGTAAWGRKIRGQYRFPDDEDAEFPARIAGEKVFGCGGPPQTRRSSRGEQEDDTRAVRRGVKRALEFGEVGCRQNEERRLSRRCLGRSPKIHTR
jgi:hypothetical protein